MLRKKCPKQTFPSTSSTRWVTKLRLYKRFRENEDLLRCFSTRLNISVDKKELLINDEFWATIKTFEKILTIIHKCILKCEKDSATVLTCYNCIKSLQIEVYSICEEEVKFKPVLQIMEKALKHVNMTIVNSSNYYNPNSKWVELKTEDLEKIKQFLFDMSDDKNELIKECYLYENVFEQYNGKRVNNMVIKSELDIQSYWGFNKHVFPMLFKMFVKFSSVPITSCSVEEASVFKDLLRINIDLNFLIKLLKIDAN